MAPRSAQARITLCNTSSARMKPNKLWLKAPASDCVSLLEGHFEDGQRTGEGTRRYANGDIYYGFWRNGKHSGEGTYIFSTTKYKVSRLDKAWLAPDSC